MKRKLGEILLEQGMVTEAQLEVARAEQLFRQADVEERRSELVIFLTPTVLDPPTIRRVTAQGDAALENLDELRLRRRAIRSSWWR